MNTLGPGNWLIQHVQSAKVASVSELCRISASVVSKRNASRTMIEIHLL